MDIKQLIAALEAASEGNEFLNAQIQKLSNALSKPIPRYTSSIDKALTLMPGEWSLHRLCREADAAGRLTRWRAEVYRAGHVLIDADTTSSAATAPLAICAAALRATAKARERAQENETHALQN
jgi:hypothetical protein